MLYMSCAVFMIFYTIDSQTTDLMKKDLDARSESRPPDGPRMSRSTVTANA